MDRSEKTILISLIVIVIFCLCASISLVFLAKSISPTGTLSPTSLPTLTAISILQTPIPTSTPVRPVVEISAGERTLQTLREAVLPPADLFSLAYKFEGKTNLPAALDTPPVDYRLGDQQSFWIWETDKDANHKVDATLRYETTKLYFWIEDGVPYDEAALKTVAETFANEIVPKDHSFFGTERIPGVDNDPHLYVLYARNMGTSIAGYMSAVDSVVPAVSEYSNAHEMFSINADVQTLEDPYTLSVMAHELQHLIHQAHDPNEDLWLNEGFSELASLINGYRTGGFDQVFITNPDLQLNDWGNGEEDTTPHYGASFLFVTYMMGRFGEEFTREVVASDLNGFESIDGAFSKLQTVDPGSGNPETLDLLFADWAVTNFLQDETVGDGRYSYTVYPDAPKASPTERQTDCVDLQESREVFQYGTDYVQLICDQPSVFVFQGQPEVQVIPVVSADGSAFMWSNIANTSDTTMTREFDLRNEDAPIQLKFDVWYDLEPLYDFGYVLASEDGTTWQPLVSTSCTSANLTGNNYGCGFNGSSKGWKKETVDLSAYAGKQIWLRFESITDAAVLGEGMVVDNVAIPQLDYFEDFNLAENGWSTEGFTRIDNVLPQTFLISVIDEDKQINVTSYTVQAGEKLEIPIRAATALHPVTIVISGSTRYTRQKALYDYSVTSIK